MDKIQVKFMFLCLIESGKKDFSRFTVWHSFFKNEKSNLAHTQLSRPLFISTWFFAILQFEIFFDELIFSP